MSSPWLRYALVIALISCDGTLGVLLPPYLKHQGYDFAAIGFLVAIGGVAALASRMPAGAIYNPRYARYIVAAALVAEGTTAWFFPDLDGPFAIGVAQAIIGFAFGVAGTINLAMLMDLVPSGGSRHRAMGFYAGCTSAGHLVGSLAGGVGGDNLGFGAGFRMASGLALLALIFLLVDRTALLRHVDDGIERSRASLPFSVKFKALLEPKVVELSIVALLTTFFQSVLMTFFPLFALDAGLSLTEIGLAKSAHSFVNTIARPLSGPAITRMGVQRVSYAGLAALSVVSSVMPFIPYFWPMTVGFVITGILRSLVLVANTIGIADLDEKRISRGVASSLYNSAKDLGSLSSPTICGTLAATVGLGAMLVSVPLGAIVVCFGVIAVHRLRSREVIVTAPDQVSAP